MNGSQKRVCLLTGAGGRLGEMFCRMFGERYEIAAVFRRSHPKVPSQLQWLVDPLMPRAPVPDNKSAVFAIQADLRQESDLHRVVEVALARFGRIDILVNAAAYSRWAPMLDGDELYRSFHEQMDVNVFVPLRLSALVAHKFWKNREIENRHANRCIVNVSSTAGLYIYPDQGQSAYSASKAALNYMTMHMAHEFGAIGVHVNALAPNSFPRLIPTEAASDAVMRLAETDVTGKILILDTNGERWS
jgi:NAD(P)-dependent dehydrogenase (short-subunit alcohol dehydrogenase family)